MIAVLVLVSLVNACLLGWLVREAMAAKSLKGLITANYLALNRLNLTAELMEDAVATHREVLK